jgi:hypothetical protein
MLGKISHQHARHFDLFIPHCAQEVEYEVGRPLTE